MSVPLSARCFACHLSRNVEKALKLGDEATAAEFARELMAFYLTAPRDVSSPWLGPGTTALLRKYYRLPEDPYREEKERSNRFVLERMDSLRSLAESQPDPLLAALKLAILGNYIDFSALGDQVRFSYLEELLSSAMDMKLDAKVYARFRRALEGGKKLLYLTDNAGEIGFDRILGERIHREFPDLAITFCVRGGFTANDATRSDAQAVGIGFPVIDNGNLVAGTELSLLGEEARKALEEADVILSKGQGNAETLLGSGYPVYYAFLVKCPLFQERFQAPKLTPMFVSERSE